MPQPKLHATQARIIVAHEAKVARLKRQLEQAKVDRAEVRARYADRVPVGEVIEVAGYAIKRLVKTTGQHFSLKGYLEKHQLTAKMRPFVSEPSPYEDWHVTPTK